MTARDRTFTGRLESLNALRGVAVLLVLFFHFMPDVLPAGFAGFCGLLGVVLFFFLSGFFIDRTLAQDDDVIPFAVRRAARVLPMYWVSLLAAFALGAWTLRDLMHNAAFLVPVTRAPLMSGVYWTLYIEAVFYVTAPVLARLGWRAIALSLYAAVALDIAVFAARGQASHTLLFLTICLTGMQFGLWHRARIGGAALALAVAVSVIHAAALSPTPGPLSLAAAISAAALFAVLNLAAAGRNTLSFFGDISYSLYLLHAVFGQHVTTWLRNAGLDVWSAAAGGLAVSIAVSWLTYRLIEQPAMAAGRRLAGTRGERLPDEVV